MKRPINGEADAYYFKYINLVIGDDPIVVLESQLQTVIPELARVSESDSLARYAPDKWSIRQVVSHVADAERIFAFRALWFGRGLPHPLPGFDQDQAIEGAEADSLSWADHVADLRAVRSSTISLLKGMPRNAWSRTGTASGSLISVNALAYIIAGHFVHHLNILKTCYGVQIHSRGDQ